MVRSGRNPKSERDASRRSSRSTLFYESDADFRESMVRFIEAGLAASESVITISTSETRAAILEVLAGAAVDVRGAFTSGQLLMLDAREILCAVLTNDRPSPERFDAVVTKMLDRVASRRSRAPIRVFSEMVDLLVKTDRALAASELDALWEALGEHRDFSILTAHSVPRSEMRAAIASTHAKTRPEMPAVSSRSGERPRVSVPSPADEPTDRDRDELVATMSHELRTPLNAILAFATLLETTIEQPGPLEAVHAIVRNARLQARLIDDLLDVSRIAAGTVTLESAPVDLVTIVREAISIVASAARERAITIRFTPETATLPTLGDATRLSQIVWNLLANAIKFSEHEGTVAVALAERDDVASLVVTDGGRGIDPAFLPHVFERFRQAGPSSTRTGGGLGLGLAIAKELVHLHDGTIEAASDGLGRGATFTVTLPLRAPVTSTSPPPTPAAAVASLEGITVLVVDDDADTRALLTTLLESRGATVVSAASASGARATLRDFRPDVIVSDVRMPEEDGYAFARSLAGVEGARGVPAIALTGFATRGERARALAAGFAGHVTKPVRIEIIVAEILAKIGR